MWSRKLYYPELGLHSFPVENLRGKPYGNRENVCKLQKQTEL